MKICCSWSTESTSGRKAKRSVCFALCGWLVKIVLLIDTGVKLTHLKEALKAFWVNSSKLRNTFFFSFFMCILVCIGLCIVCLMSVCVSQKSHLQSWCATERCPVQCHSTRQIWSQGDLQHRRVDREFLPLHHSQFLFIHFTSLYLNESLFCDLCLTG